MMGAVRRIRWTDITEALPAFLVLVGIPLSSSIADGMAAGFISWPVVKLAAGRRREVSPVLWLLAAAFVLKYVLS